MGPKTLLRNFFAKRRHTVSLEKYGWFGRHLHSPDLWHFGRRSVAGGVGLGLFLCFIPIPIQMMLAIPCAIVLRVNLPVTFTAKSGTRCSSVVSCAGSAPAPSAACSCAGYGAPISSCCAAAGWRAR